MPDLVYGMSDPDSVVRNVSLWALAMIARYAQNAPEQGIKVPRGAFVKLLNSLDWTDRNKSSSALLQLTEKRDAALLSQLRWQALPSLVEMARWKSAGHALTPFFLVRARR